jgi:hypothetical protein
MREQPEEHELTDPLAKNAAEIAIAATDLEETKFKKFVWWLSKFFIVFLVFDAVLGVYSIERVNHSNNCLQKIAESSEKQKEALDNMIQQISSNVGDPASIEAALQAYSKRPQEKFNCKT